MKYFLTGATGFVGSWVARQLVDQGEQVRCLVRKTSNLRWLDGLNVEYHEGSLFDRASLEAGVKGMDFVLHIGGVTKAFSIDEFYRGNVEATGNILEATRSTNPHVKKFVHVSSQAAFGPSPSSDPVDEDVAPQPLTDYGKSKLQAEEAVMRFMDDLPITILRPPTVYGPRDTDVLEVFKNIKNKVNLKVGKVNQVVSIIHVLDLARGIIHAAGHGKSTGQAYFICNEAPAQWSHVVGLLEEIMDKKAINVTVPRAVAYGFAGVMELGARISGKPSILNRQKILEVSQPFWVISPQKIKDQLGFDCDISLEDGLRQTHAWYRENGWL